MNPLGNRQWVLLALVAFFLIGLSGLAMALVGVNGMWRLAAQVGFIRSPDTLPEIPDDDLPDITQSLPNPGFLGPRACAPCHAKRVEDFLKTNHANAMRIPDPNLMPNGFQPGKNRIGTGEPDFHLDMVRLGPDFFQKSLALSQDGKWQTDTKKIDFVYGWGKLDEVNFSWENDKLWELPVAWIYPMEKWGISSTYLPGMSPSSSREATPNCLECHTTWFSHYPGTANRYKPESFILGVTCERCHGPGKEHVEHHQAHPGEKKVHSVVNPGKLSRERQIEVCTQCHSNAIREKGQVFSYRPGEPLENFYRTIHPKYPEDDHVANQITYLRKSKCFQQSESLTCGTCHDPHKPHEPRKGGASQGFVDPVSCSGCHQPEACREQLKIPEAVRNDCIGCHMPPRVWMNVNFHIGEDRFVPPIRRYDHRIGIYPEATLEVLLRHDETHSPEKKSREIQNKKTELVNHWVKEAKTRRASHRILGAIGATREGLRIDPTNRELRNLLAIFIEEQSNLVLNTAKADQKRTEGDYQTAKALLEKALEIKPDFALGHGKLGAILSSMGQKQAARRELLSVTQLDPDESYGIALLGWLAYLDRVPAEAIHYLKLADEIEPFVAKTQFQMGLAYLQWEKWSEGRTYFEKALRIDPQHAGARQGLSHCLRKMGTYQESLIQARIAAKLTFESNPDILLTLVEAYLANGDAKNARVYSEKGLELAKQANQSELERQFRSRLKQVKSPKP